MKSPIEVANAYNLIDAHDDTIERIHITPGTSARSQARIEIVLHRHYNGTKRLLRFTRCANIEFVVDAAILLDNHPSNTLGLFATTDPKEIEQLVRRQATHWNVDYDGSDPTASATRWPHYDAVGHKLMSVQRLVIFRVELFGGVLTVLAPNFTIVRYRKQ